MRILLLFLLLPCVLGVGLSSQPLDGPILFEPGKTYTINYDIVGDDEVSLSLKEGYLGDIDMRPYARLTEIDGKSFSLILSFPENATISQGGMQSVVVSAKGESDSSVNVGGTAIVQKTVPIQVYFQEKRIKSSMRASDININETGQVEIHAESWSHQDIGSISTEIEIRDSEGSVLATMSDKDSLPSGKEVTLSGSFDTSGWAAGDYQAFADLSWDGNSTELQDGFRIGSLEVSIINYTESVLSENINKFFINIQSGWNNDLKDVYAVVFVDGQKMFKTANYDIGAWEQVTMSDYLDTEGIEPGVHEITISLHYGGEKTVVTDSLSVEKPPEEEQALSTTSIVVVLAVALVLLIAFNVFWFMRR
ncbi:MAG: hypothetical protein R6V53_01185 [Candidatus Woesearchaeota archaeon]